MGALYHLVDSKQGTIENALRPLTLQLLLKEGIMGETRPKNRVKTG
jgi:hypothetical protein